jgi:phage gp29-like protein
MVKPQLVDHLGRPVSTALLKREQGGPTTRGIRRPYDGLHPAVGLTPDRLARLLRDSIDGEPDRYLALAEDMEERDPHYAGVHGIRKRQVAGLEVTVEAASDAADDVAAADLVREVIARDTFSDELIDILDAIGKGFSATEIIWDTSEGQWRPLALRMRDPKWFRYSRDDGDTLLLREPEGDVPLQPFGWIVHQGKAKSGLPIRGGIARAVAWTYLFKSFTFKDWAIFCEAYGQPLRLGKWEAGASDEDKDTLLRAVSDIGTDFAAIVPASMTIDFVKADITGSIDLYERRCDWLDRQVSKVVLGQTQTTDATAGGYATAAVHDGVRDDIEEADARQLAATLNRDLMRPLVDLNLRPRKLYPKIRIGRPDEEDTDALVKNVVQLVPLGLRVSTSVMRDKLGLPDPGADEECLRPGSPPAAADPSQPTPEAAMPPTVPPEPLRRKTASAQLPIADAIDDGVSEILAGDGWEKIIAPMVSGLQEKLQAAQTLDEVKAVLAAHLTSMDIGQFVEVLSRAGFSARLAGAAGDGLSAEE